MMSSYSAATAIMISESDSAPCRHLAHSRWGTTTGITLITIRKHVTQHNTTHCLVLSLVICFLIVIGQTTRLWRHTGVHHCGDTNNTRQQDECFSVHFLRGVVITNKIYNNRCVASSLWGKSNCFQSVVSAIKHTHRPVVNTWMHMTCRLAIVAERHNFKGTLAAFRTWTGHFLVSQLNCVWNTRFGGKSNIPVGPRPV